MPEEFIRIKTWVTDHAQKAYKSKNYIEAIQVLHGWIENKLQEILILTGATDHGSEMKIIWEIVNQVNLVTCAHVLFVLSQLSENEYQMIIKFNGVRNQLIHKIYNDPYEKINHGFPKEKYDEAYKIGIELADLLQFKTESKIQ
jgi:hypothetical protein